MNPLFVFSALTKTLGAGINFFGQRQQGRFALEQGAMERQLYGKNADLAEQQAADAEARGVESSLKQSYRMRTLLGAQNSGFAGQGVLASGTAAGVIRSDQAIGEADRLNMIENARREAWGYRQQSNIYREQGNLAYRTAQNRQKAYNLESIGTLANFAGDMFSMYKGYKS